MNIIEIIKLVVKNINARKGRMFLTLIGIIIGIFTFTFFVFVSNGLSNAISEQFSSLGSNVLGVKLITDQNMPTSESLTDKEVEEIKQVTKEVKYIVPIIIRTEPIQYGREKNYAVTLAYKNNHLLDVFKDVDLEVAEGRLLRTNDRNSALIGDKIAHDFFSKYIKVGTTLIIDNEKFRVIGIIKRRGDLFVDKSIFINFNDMKKITNSKNYGAIRIKFYDGADLKYYKKQIENKLNPNKNEKKFSVTSAEDVIEKFNSILGLLTAIISFISIIALFVGGVNLMNTMYSNVNERISDISIMKALGASNSTIRNMFIIESAVLGLFGGLIGYFGSFTLAKIISLLILKFTGYKMPIYLNVTFLSFVLLFTTGFTILFGTYPAIKASKINPADNLKDE